MSPGGGPAAPDSPLARLRANYAARQQAQEAAYVDVWPDGDLVAMVKRPDDVSGARGVLRTMAALTVDSSQLDVSAEDLADVVAEATASLHTRTGDTYEPLLSDDELPLKFDGRLAAVLDWPASTTPRDAVFLAFTDGEPPTLDTVRLMVCATNIAVTLATAGANRRANAEAVVGEASALES